MRSSKGISFFYLPRQCLGGTRDKALVKEVCRILIEDLGKDAVLSSRAKRGRESRQEPLASSFALSSKKMRSEHALAATHRDPAPSELTLRICKLTLGDSRSEDKAVHQPLQFSQGTIDVLNAAMRSGGRLAPLPLFSKDRKHVTKSTRAENLTEWLRSPEAADWRKMREELWGQD